MGGVATLFFDGYRLIFRLLPSAGRWLQYASMARGLRIFPVTATVVITLELLCLAFMSHFRPPFSSLIFIVFPIFWILMLPSAPPLLLFGATFSDLGDMTITAILILFSGAIWGGIAAITSRLITKWKVQKTSK